MFAGRRMPSGFSLCPGGLGRRAGFVPQVVLTCKVALRGAQDSTPGKFPWGKSSLHVLLLDGSLSIVGGGPAYRGRLITSGRFIPEPCNPLRTCLLLREAIKLPSTETVPSASGLHQKCLLSTPRGFCLPGMREAAGKGSPSPCGTDGLAD